MTCRHFFYENLVVAHVTGLRYFIEFGARAAPVNRTLWPDGFGLAGGMCAWSKLVPINL